MNFADQKMVRKLRKEFPVGCRIVLDEMDDRQAPPIGTQGRAATGCVLIYSVQ